MYVCVVIQCDNFYNYFFPWIVRSHKTLFECVTIP